MENARLGGGTCCQHCGEFISNAGFNMSRHLNICPKNLRVNEPKLNPVKMKQISEDLLDELVDIAQDHFIMKMALDDKSEKDDAEIADIAQTLSDAKTILYEEEGT